LGWEKDEVWCDVMGDVRYIRHWILHTKSVADEKRLKKMKILDWPDKPGPIVLGALEMQNLQRAINSMTIYKREPS
ncbi:MAG: hypothetical protein ACU0DI_05045, partial [Paracoccaceae bacterium]